MELVRFVGYFLAIGSIGFRFGVVRRTREMSDEARTILRADKAAMLGLLPPTSARPISSRSPRTRASSTHCPQS